MMVTALEERCMTYSSSGSVDGQLPREPDNLNISLGKCTSTISLTGLIDLLSALDPEISELPSPYPLFARELEAGIAASLQVAE